MYSGGMGGQELALTRSRMRMSRAGTGAAAAAMAGTGMAPYGGRGTQQPGTMTAWDVGANQRANAAVTVYRRYHLERLVDSLYDILESDASAVEYRRTKQQLAKRKVYNEAMAMKAKWAKLQADKRALEIEKQCFEAARRAAWQGEASGAVLLPQTGGGDGEAGKAGAVPEPDHPLPDSGDAGAGEVESKGQEAGVSALAKKRAASNEKRYRLNVGGQIFETTAAVLRREPDSLLAALTFAEPPVKADAEGTFFFDRDWWLFRHVLHFLREGGTVLPSSRTVLRSLYKEAGYWRLPALRLALRQRFQRADDREIARKALSLGGIIAPTDPLVTQSAFGARVTGGDVPLGTTGLYGNAGYGNAGYGNAAYGNAAYGNAGYGNAGYGNPAYGNPEGAMRAGMPPSAGFGGSMGLGMSAMGGAYPAPNQTFGMAPLGASMPGSGLGNPGASGLYGGGAMRGLMGGAAMGPNSVAPYEARLDPALVAFEKSFGAGGGGPMGSTAAIL